MDIYLMDLVRQASVIQDSTRRLSYKDAREQKSYKEVSNGGVIMPS